MAESATLVRQIYTVFRQLSEELAYLSSGTVFIQIRNNVIGKFGIRHVPLQGRDGKVEEVKEGLSASQVASFRQLTIDALKHKRGWTHGEIYIDFAIRQNLLSTSVQIESNYNMAAVLPNLRNQSDNSII